MTLHHTYPQSQRAIIVCGNKISSPARFLLTKIQTKFKFVSRPVAAMPRGRGGPASARRAGGWGGRRHRLRRARSWHGAVAAPRAGRGV